MRLYPKKIHNLQELHDERMALKRAAQEGSDIFSFTDKKPGKKKGARKAKEEVVEEASGGLDMGGILGSVIGDKGMLNTLLSAGLPLVIDMIPRKTKIKFFRKVITEVGEAYIGWKAVKLGYHILQSFFKPSTKEKTRERYTY